MRWFYLCFLEYDSSILVFVRKMESFLSFVWFDGTGMTLYDVSTTALGIRCTSRLASACTTDLSRPPSGVHRGPSLARSLKSRWGFAGGRVLPYISHIPKLTESPSPVRPSSLGRRCPRGRGSLDGPMRHGRRPCRSQPCEAAPNSIFFMHQLAKAIIATPTMRHACCWHVWCLSSICHGGLCREHKIEHKRRRNGSPRCKLGQICARFFEGRAYSRSIGNIPGEMS